MYINHDIARCRAKSPARDNDATLLYLCCWYLETRYFMASDVLSSSLQEDYVNAWGRSWNKYVSNNILRTAITNVIQFLESILQALFYFGDVLPPLWNFIVRVLKSDSVIFSMPVVPLGLILLGVDTVKTGILICCISFGVLVQGCKVQQGKSEGFDSCDRPSNLAQIWSKSSIFQPVWPWNSMDDLGKQ